MEFTHTVHPSVKRILSEFILEEQLAMDLIANYKAFLCDAILDSTQSSMNNAAEVILIMLNAALAYAISPEAHSIEDLFPGLLVLCYASRDCLYVLIDFFRT